MEADDSFPMEEVPESRLTADWKPVQYLGISYYGGACFENSVAPASEHVGGDQLTSIPADMSSFMASIGTIPMGFEVSDGALAAPSFGTLSGVHAEAGMAPQALAGSNSNKPPTHLKSSWTEEEDSILRDMVGQHGERKWSVIAQCLPGRIGKQCRERWINHLRPDIKQNDVWTEDDDKTLIDAHRSHGNRWSAIARYLPGRSENAIKNHWNATLRSLKAKRRLKKKRSEQAPLGQFSVLEEYIRSLSQEDGMPAAPPPPSSSPPHHPQHIAPAYSGPLTAVVHASATSSAIPSTKEMNFIGDNSAVASNLGMINLNMQPQLPDLNTTSDSQEYYMNNPMYTPAPPSPQLQLATQYPQQQDYSSLLEYVDYFTLLSTDGTYHAGASSSNPGANGYYTEAGRSSAGGRGEFMMPANDEMSLDFTRFK